MQPRLMSPLLRAADAPRAHSEVGRLERLVISALITHLELQEHPTPNTNPSSTPKPKPNANPDANPNPDP